MLNLHRYEVIDWDDPEIDPDPQTNNLLHCQRAGRLGAAAELIVSDLLYESPWVEVRFKTQTAQYAVVGVARAGIWLVLFREFGHSSRLVTTGYWLAGRARRDPTLGKGDWTEMERKAMNIERPHDLIESYARLGESKRLDQMISARLDPTLVAELKQMAVNRGVSLSDIVREATLLLLRREKAKNVVRFQVHVTNGRIGAVSDRSFDQEIASAG